MIQTVNGKLGSMRKSQSWVVYPCQKESQSFRIIQCERYIAKIELETGETILSSGKGGHPGFHMLNPILGARSVPCCPDILEQLKSKVKQVGAIRVL